MATAQRLRSWQDFELVGSGSASLRCDEHQPPRGAACYGLDERRGCFAMLGWFESGRDAIAAWNRRSPPPSQTRESQHG